MSRKRWMMGTVKVMKVAPTRFDAAAALARIESKIDAILAALRRRKR